MSGLIAISTLPRHLKVVRESLVHLKVFDGKIIPDNTTAKDERRLLVVTTLSINDAEALDESAKVTWLEKLQLSNLQEQVEVRIVPLHKPVVVPEVWKRFKEDVQNFIARHPPENYNTVQNEVQDLTCLTTKILQGAIPDEFKYDLYPPLLLIPANSPLITSEPWKTYLSILDAETKQEFYHTITTRFKTTHIAINSPIPVDDNIIRKPLITPVYGDFGPDFWVSTTQNGIYQTWQPMYTMFSRGNIKEKARVLDMISTCPEQQNFTAVDLYVGIGYFAFSYLKGGASLVLGWDINERSLEGCRRGAKKNGWNVRKYGHEEMDVEIGKDKLLIFHESNIHAPARMHRLKETIPPIKYINLGLLPTSKAAYELAVEIATMNQPLVPVLILAHENIGCDEIEEKTSNVVESFKVLVDRICQDRDKFRVECNHVEKVKSWAPKVFHCVLDIQLVPLKKNHH